MIKDKDNFTCNKMYSSICNTNLAGQKNCDCCDYNFDKCNHYCNKDTSVCKNCTHQKNEEKSMHKP